MTKKLEKVYTELTIDERILLLRELSFSNITPEARDEEFAKVVDTIRPYDVSKYNYAALKEMESRYQWLNYKLVLEILKKAYFELEQVAERRRKLILRVDCVARMLIQDSNFPAKTKKELMMEWSDDFTSFMYTSIYQSEWFQQRKLSDREFLRNRMKCLAELEMQTSFPPCKPDVSLSNDEIRSKLHHTYVLALEIISNEHSESYATSIMLFIAGEKEPMDLSDPEEALKLFKRCQECLKTRFLDDDACKDMEFKYQQQISLSPGGAPMTREFFQTRATDYIQAALAKEIEKETETIS